MKNQLGSDLNMPYAYKLQEGVQAAHTTHIPSGMSVDNNIYKIEQYLLSLLSEEDLKKVEPMVNKLRQEDPQNFQKEYLKSTYGLDLNAEQIDHLEHLLYGIAVKYSPHSLMKDISRIHKMLIAVLLSNPFDTERADSRSVAEVRDTMNKVFATIQSIIAHTPYSEHLPEALWGTQNLQSQGFEVVYARRILDYIREMSEDPLFVQGVDGARMETLVKIGTLFQIYDPKILESNVISIGRNLQDKIQQLRTIAHFSAVEVRPVLQNVLGYLEALHTYKLIPERKEALRLMVSALMDAVVKHLRIPAIEEEEGLSKINISERPYFSVPEYADILRSLKKVDMVDSKYHSPNAKNEILQSVESYYKNSRLVDVSDSNLAIVKEFSMERFLLILETLKSLGWIHTQDLLNTPGISEHTSKLLSPHIDFVLTSEKQAEGGEASPVLREFLRTPEKNKKLTAERFLKELTHPTLDGLLLLQNAGLLGVGNMQNLVLGNEYISFAKSLVELCETVASKIDSRYLQKDQVRPAFEEVKLDYKRLPYINYYEKIEYVVSSLSLSHSLENEERRNFEKLPDRILAHLLDDMLTERRSFLHMKKILLDLKSQIHLKEEEVFTKKIPKTLLQMYKEFLKKKQKPFQEEKHIGITDVIKVLEQKEQESQEEYFQSSTLLRDVLRRWYHVGFRIIKEQNLFSNYVQGLSSGRMDENVCAHFAKRFIEECTEMMQYYLSNAENTEVRALFSIEQLWEDVFHGMVHPPYTEAQIKEMGIYWKEYSIPHGEIKTLFNRPEIASKAFGVLKNFQEDLSDKEILKVDAIVEAMNASGVVDTSTIVEKRFRGIHPIISNTLGNISLLKDKALIHATPQGSLRSRLVHMVSHPEEHPYGKILTETPEREEKVKHYLVSPLRMSYSLRTKARFQKLHDELLERTHNEELFEELCGVSNHKIIQKVSEHLYGEYINLYGKEMKELRVSEIEIKSLLEEILTQKVHDEGQNSHLHVMPLLRGYLDKFQYHHTRWHVPVALWYGLREGGQYWNLLNKHEKHEVFQHLTTALHVRKNASPVVKNVYTETQVETQSPQ